MLYKCVHIMLQWLFAQRKFLNLGEGVKELSRWGTLVYSIYGPAHAAGHGFSMDSWQHCSYISRRAVVRRCWSPGTNGIDRLSCGYVYRSSHWIGKSVSGFRPCCRHRGVRLSIWHAEWFMFNSRVVFELTHDATRTK